MYKLLSLGILLCFFAIQNAPALTLKKGETLGSDGQINSSNSQDSDYGNVSSEMNGDCKGRVDKKVPQVTKLDCSLKRVSKYIKHSSGTIKSHHIPSEDAAMTVRGFPGHPKSNVFRFQTMIGVCAKNDFDCRPENIKNKTIRSEVSLPEEDADRANVGDRTVVEYDLYIASNPEFNNLAANGDWFNFGQIHGHGDEDVPITVAITRNDNRVKLVENGKRTNLSPPPGSLAVYMRSIVFDEVLQKANQNSAVVLAEQGSFEDRWMRIRIEVQWETTKTGRVDIQLDGKKVFECEDCVTMPIYKEAAVRDGIKGKQLFKFQFGIYSWRRGNSNHKKDPPMVVAYYKDVSWEKM